MNLEKLKEKYGDSFLNTLRSNVIKIGTENPDFVYTTLCGTPRAAIRCTYYGGAKTIEGEPAGPECSGCIFGQALQLMGWDDNAEMHCSFGIATLLNTSIPFMEVPILFPKVQSMQDQGMPWGECVACLKD